MNRIRELVFVSLFILAICLAGSALAAYGPGVELRPGEAESEMLFNYGIGEKWIGGDPPSNEVDSIYAQYYSLSPATSAKKHIQAPKKSDMRDQTPASVYFSYQMKAMPFDQYQAYATYAGGNSLWIQGSSSWTQYAKAPKGSALSLIAVSNAGGRGVLYEINPDGKLNELSFSFYPGYNQMDFYADSIGQHILLYVIDGLVSNSIVIDVTGYYQPPYQQPAVSTLPKDQIQPPESQPSPFDAQGLIVSQGMRGYQLFVNGIFMGTEGSGGDALDGRFSFGVAGNRNHEIRVYDGQFNYLNTIYFPRGVQKRINVEPGFAA